MLKKAIIAAVVAAFIPVVAQAAPGNHDRNDRGDRHGPAISIKYDNHGGYHNNHGPRIVYKTIFQTKKVVKIVWVHGRPMKVVRYVKVPVKVAFINGRPMHRL